MPAPSRGDEPASFGQWLKRRRQALDLTQDQLAEQVGYASATMRKIERGERRPSRELAARLVDVLAISPEEQPLFLRLARGVDAADAPAVVSAPPPHPPDAPFVVHTRLQPPPLRASLVPRPRLSSRIAGGQPGVVTLVVAPAGWGKTTAVRAWLSDLDTVAQQRVAWLALDPADDDPAALLRALVAALQHIEPACGQGVLRLLDGPPPSPAIGAGMLVNELARLAQPLALVLDDYHLLQNRAAHELLRALVEHLPPTVRLIVASREDPPLPLTRLRARGQLDELRAADLRFSREEAAALLNALGGFTLDPEAVATLSQRTEGWAAGLQLAALALRERERPGDFVRDFSGSHRLILDFLVEEVLNRLPDHLRRFLLQTAILDQLCGPLCDAVLLGSRAVACAEGEPYSQGVLEELERAQLFLVPLDDTRTWYRYHHLFGEVLRARLGRGAGPVDVRALHRGAAAWYAGERRWPDAFRHGCAAHAWELAADALEQFGEELLLQSSHRLHPLLLALPEPVRSARPRLLLYEGLCLLYNQDYAAAQPALARAAAGGAAAGAGALRGEALLHLSDLQRGSGDFAAAHQTLQQALLTPLPPRTRVMALLSRAWEALAGGDWPASTASLDAALVLVLGSADRRTWLELAVNTHAPLLALPGRVAWAEQFLSAELPWSEPPLSPLRAARRRIAGYCALLRGELSPATTATAEALRLNTELGGGAKLYLDAALALVLLLAVQGDLAGAERELGAVLARLEQPELAVYMEVWGHLYRYVQGWLRLQQGHSPEAQAIAALIATPSASEWPTAPAARLLLQGQIALNAGTLAEAQAALKRAAAEQTRFADAFMLGDARVPLALVALRAGREEEALSTLRSALDEHVRRGTPGVLLLMGAAVVVPLLQLAQTHQLHPALAKQLLDALGAPTLQAPTMLTASATSDALTAREREVLGLLARGASNQAIAAALIISLPTAKTHVSRILDKLGASNRTEALAHARERSLL